MYRNPLAGPIGTETVSGSRYMAILRATGADCEPVVIHRSSTFSPVGSPSWFQESSSSLANSLSLRCQVYTSSVGLLFYRVSPRSIHRFSVACVT